MERSGVRAEDVKFVDAILGSGVQGDAEDACGRPSSWKPATGASGPERGGLLLHDVPAYDLLVWTSMAPSSRGQGVPPES